MNRDPALQHPLIQRLIDARSVTDALFAVVKSEFLYERPIRERHRIVFYIGHLEAFDRNLFDERLCALPAFAPALDQLFAFGIDPVDGGFPTDQPADWPSLDVVHGYAREAREQIDRELEAFEFGDSGMATGSPEQLLHVAIEHRLMHAETLAYMLHQLPLDMKIPPPRDTSPGRSNDVLSSMVRVPAGQAVLGMKKEQGRFGWDNEFGEKRVDVDSFEIDRYMVTNGEFLAFVDAGGYDTRTHWNDKDWAWKEAEQIAYPVGWSKHAEADKWTLRTMFYDIPLPRDWPVYVSQAEASAYAASGNFDFRSWDPQAVDAHPDNASTFGVEGQFGNGWEWTSSLFEPLPGFDAFPFYLGYSANFFDGQHYVLKGGSARTAQCMLRPTFRNWFQAHYQHVYAGFRCVRND
jgi:gamma-glutamyl hercynylcysteine S-oxide synthase